MRAIGVIQCRMSSTRLPGKAMETLRNRPVLEWVILRSLRSSSLDRVVLATTNYNEDNPVAGFGGKFGLPVVRGSRDNVLERFGDVIERFPAEAVVRITGDNPLIDPETMDREIVYFFENNLDYCYAAKIPYGAGADIFRGSELVILAEHARDPRHKEHINTYFLDNHLRYRLSSLPPAMGHKRPDVRVTLDTPEDLKRLQAIFQLLENPEECGLREIIAAYDSLPEPLKGALIY